MSKISPSDYNKVLETGISGYTNVNPQNSADLLNNAVIKGNIDAVKYLIDKGVKADDSTLCLAMANLKHNIIGYLNTKGVSLSPYNVIKCYAKLTVDSIYDAPGHAYTFVSGSLYNAGNSLYELVASTDSSHDEV